MNVHERAQSYGLSRKDILDMAGEFRAESFNHEQRSAEITSSAAGDKLFVDFLGGRKHEHFAVAYLDTHLQVIKLEIAFHGTLDSTPVYPRVIAARALELNAAAVLAGHNHPSGDAEPSVADRAVTHRLKDALELLDIRLLDHFIVGQKTTSMAERGML